MSTHYSDCTLHPEILVDNAKKAVEIIKYLKLLYPHYNFNLVFRGMSGCMIASAVASEYYKSTNNELGMIYIRKLKEEAHSHNPIEYNFPFINNNFFIFVDDFIDSGKTYAICKYELKKCFLYNPSSLMLALVFKLTQTPVVRIEDYSPVDKEMNNGEERYISIAYNENDFGYDKEKLEKMVIINHSLVHLNDIQIYKYDIRN